MSEELLKQCVYFNGALQFRDVGKFEWIPPDGGKVIVTVNGVVVNVFMVSTTCHYMINGPAMSAYYMPKHDKAETKEIFLR